MASITGWKERWPSITAVSMTSSAQLLGLGLDHQHAFLGAGDDEVEVLFSVCSSVGLITNLPSR